MVQSLQYFGPGETPSYYAALAITGARFVKAHATNGGENFGCQPATEGAYALGVAATDCAAGGTVVVISEGITDVTAGENLSAGDPVVSDSLGRAIKASTAAGSPTAATLATGVVGSNNALTWTARDAGEVGNGISVTILGSTGTSVSLSVAVAGNDITVTPATNGGGTVTSTAAQVDAAVAASSAANALVDVANTGASTGAGVVAAVSATNLSGGSEGNAFVLGVACDDAASAALAPIRLFL